MDSKTVLLFVLLPVGVVAFLVWVSLDTWRDIRELEQKATKSAAMDEEGKGSATPLARKPKKSAPTPKPSDEKSPGKREMERLARLGEKAEEKGYWQGAYNFYSRAIQLAEDDRLKLRARAVHQVIAGGRLEAEGKRDAALACYRSAVPHVGNAQAIRERIQRLEKLPEEESIAAPVSEQAGAERNTAPKREAAEAKSDNGEAVGLMKKVFRRLREERLYYACLAACVVYMSEPVTQAADDFLGEQRRFALLAIRAAGREGETIRETEAKRFAHIVVDGGTEIDGLLVEKTKTWVKIEVEHGGVSGAKIIPRKDLVSIKETVRSAGEINEARAKGRFRAALSLYNAGKPFLALNRMGELLHEFRDTAFLNDRSAQVGMLPADLDGSAAGACRDVAYVGRALVRRAEARALRLERLCPRCEGSGRRACTRCQGKGYVLQPCDACQGGTVQCAYCDGKGGKWCESCKRTGRIVCPTCGGRGGWTTGHGHVSQRCGRCNGTGTCDCSHCTKGWIDCEKCKKGRRRCGVCKGKGSIRETCTQCQGAKEVVCAHCGGRGELPQEPTAEKVDPNR